MSLEVCGTSLFWSWMPPCCVLAGGTRPALTGTTRCSCSSAATPSAPTATRSWADGSLLSAGQEAKLWGQSGTIIIVSLLFLVTCSLVAWQKIQEKLLRSHPVLIKKKKNICSHPGFSSTMCWLNVLYQILWYFDRGTGHWLTDVSPLLPLLDGNRCTLTMKTPPWAMPWVVSLNLRFKIGNQTGVKVGK